jgi:ABC-type branched-subunit amino acid transport system ATPase component
VGGGGNGSGKTTLAKLLTGFYVPDTGTVRKDGHVVGDAEREAAARAGDGRVAIFSPFGLGLLDLAVGKVVTGLAQASRRAQILRSFLPATPDP